MKEKELNDRYIEINSKMRELNRERVKIFDEFKKLKSNIFADDLVHMKTPTFYHDLYGKDLDK